MKPCFGKRKLLAWLALGELDERQAQDLRSHVETCEGCRHYLEDLSGLKEKLAVSEAKPLLEPSASFHRKWVARLRPEQSSSPWQVLAERLNWRIALPGLGAAAILVLLAVSLAPKRPVDSLPVRVSRAQPIQPSNGRDLSPSVANYQRAAVRSLDEFDELLTLQAQRHPSPAPTYIASMFAAATSPN
jgi:anti-sigma factor RsiW